MTTEEEVRQFFKEHPVHSIAVKSLAAYLDIGEGAVRTALLDLAEQGLVVERYQLSVKGRKELVG